MGSDLPTLADLQSGQPTSVFLRHKIELFSTVETSRVLKLLSALFPSWHIVIRRFLLLTRRPYGPAVALEIRLTCLQMNFRMLYHILPLRSSCGSQSPVCCALQWVLLVWSLLLMLLYHLRQLLQPPSSRNCFAKDCFVVLHNWARCRFYFAILWPITRSQTIETQSELCICSRRLFNFDDLNLSQLQIPCCPSFNGIFIYLVL